VGYQVVFIIMLAEGVLSSLPKSLDNIDYLTTYVARQMAQPGSNPTIASYNASVVKTYSAVNSMARF
jgi:hypothetical protein